MISAELIKKYDVPVPRYTSYPTVPYWTDSPTSEEWIDHVQGCLAPSESNISIYVHVPFCETLCTFCGCNTSITKNHSVEDPYIETLAKEFQMYYDSVPELKNREFKELHLGGGSPTYLSEDHLHKVVYNLLTKLKVSDSPVFSIEVDPRRTRKEQLKVLSDLGFKRISLGVQDFNEEVQKLINRFQPYEKTKFVTETARELGYNSVNFDLIYGLPRQTESSMVNTIEKTLELMPDRIAFYSYAHVPWIKPSQRLFTEKDLPLGPEKRKLYEVGRSLFEQSGYVEIGMDHFALKTDNLWRAVLESKLHRNFMGYTENKTDLLLGLGVSSISDSWDAFHQNEKILKKYNKRIGEGKLPTLRGHKLTQEDILYRKLILKLSTSWEVEIPENIFGSVRDFLITMEEDYLIHWENNHLKVTDKGRPFLRNVCMGLDFRLRAKSPESSVFSQAI
ncbi:MAG: oxygen-independent coproporphyrinogen III oxidase [Leptospiraceae bacterium]|nr:oxygen-independent coproporphyrinogen III oxidase [Leptospiraceae bacterium]MCP5496699.1 oxygen-independent coproporphyrinogen III oxidase [Leptospiraceae bacterium]